MSRFREELRVIPRTAWIVASLLCLIALACAVYSMRTQAGFILLGMAPLAVIFGIYILLVGYVYSDARRRGMRYVVWTLLAIFVPNAIGIILYFLLREPLQHPCPSCGAGCKAGLAYCPSCGAATGRSCPQCKCPVEESWKNCAHCGVAI